MVNLHNSSKTPFSIKMGDRIAQLLFYYTAQPSMVEHTTLDTTDRGEQGLGSSGISRPIVRNMTDIVNILDPTPEDQSNANIHEICQQIIDDDGIKPYNIWFSNDPYDNRLSIQMKLKGNHPTLGLKTCMCTKRNAIQLTDMEKSTPAARIHNWQSTLRYAYILEVQGVKVNNTEELIAEIDKARTNKLLQVQITFGTERKFGVHPVDGNLQLYFDQLNAFAKHVHESDKEYRKQLLTDQPNAGEPITIRSTKDTTATSEDTNSDLGKSFTKKQLLKRPDWQEWRESQGKQLDQYHSQGMFSDPQPLPLGLSASYMHWTYLIKMCGTKKARMVCDRARNRSANTIG